MHKLEIELTDEEYDAFRVGFACGLAWLSVQQYDGKESARWMDRVGDLAYKLFPEELGKKERRSQPGC